MLTSAMCVSSSRSSTTGSTVKSESPYSSIFGRWWPFSASSTASGWRSNSCCMVVSSSRVGSLIATQTKASGCFRYSLICSTEMSPSLRPSWYATQLTSITPPRRSPRSAEGPHQGHGRGEPAAQQLHQRALLVQLRGLQQEHVHVPHGPRL